MKKRKTFGKSQVVENPQLVEMFLKEILKDPPKSFQELEKRKNNFSSRETITTIQNRDLIAIAQKLKIKVPDILQKRKVRTISGVSPIGILTKQYPCPGQCTYCPTEDRMPKSYMKSQPAAARAFRNNFHPFTQVQGRILALDESGHPTSKLEVIVMGGTWSFLPHKYQSWYVRKIFEAANNDQSTISNKQLTIEEKDECEAVKTNCNTPQKKSLKDIQKINETAKKRVVGLTLETRPDYINEKELKRMREFGCTRLEIGVQTLDDEVQKITKRGHYKKDVVRAMKLMKNYGFKICTHLMPGLPGSNLEKDLAWMKEIYSNPDFRPDFVKIYPCQVVPNSELAITWEKGEFKPYDDEEIIKLLVQFYIFVPEWTRIMRLMRDIPVSNILDGAKFSNLRQIIHSQPNKLKEIVGNDFYEKHDLKNITDVFRDIRAREIGFAQVDLQNIKPVLVRRDYDSSDGKEVFLSYESPDKKYLFALLRLRKPSADFEPQFFRRALTNAALIREVHSYGTEKSVGSDAGIGQHRGLGKKLLEEAEKIAREEWKLSKISVISGVGTREYYRKFGYELVSTYMTKKLK